MGTCARGDWHPEYPNVWLHPTVRAGNNWHSSVVWTRIHSELTKRGVKSEAAWKRIATRGCVLELAAWPTPTWTPGVFTSSTALSVELAQRASDDPNKVVLLCRGETEWRSAGLLDADLLPKSKGVRRNQCRVTPSNFPDVWEDVLSKFVDE